MRKITALFVSLAFSLSVAGLAMAQTKPAEKPATPGQEQKMEKKGDKMAAQKAECLKKATTDEAKSECEKKFAKRTDKPAAAKKTEKKEDAAAKKQ